MLAPQLRTVGLTTESWRDSRLVPHVCAPAWRDARVRIRVIVGLFISELSVLFIKNLRKQRKMSAGELAP